MLRPLLLALAMLVVGTRTIPVAAAQPVVRLPAADRLLTGQATSLYSVGVEEGAAWETFADVSDVAFDARDNLYVLDRGNSRVVVFDARGRFVRQIGRRGGGPGEFQGPSALTVTAQGQLVVTDLARRSYTLFGADGRFQRSVPFPQATRLPGRSVQAHPRGGVVSATDERGFAPNAPSGMVRTLVHFQWNPLADGEGERTLYRLAESAVRSDAAETPGRAGTTTRMMSNVVFAPRIEWTTLPNGGLAVSFTAEYAVRVLDAQGRVVRVLQRPINPRAVTERDRDAARESTRRALTTGEGAEITSVDGRTRPQLPPEFVRAQVQALRFADRIPVVKRLAGDAGGRLWVLRTGRTPSDDGPVDLLTAAGAYLGTLPAGTAFPDAFSASGRAAYIVRDELGFERVVVRQIPATWRPSASR